ncbi:MAG TPA: porin family protein [Gemmatimonadota bacterium]|nr:porin family protein [Gemmatimonadota bacterium]
MRRLVLTLVVALVAIGANSASAQMVSAGVMGGLTMATADVKGDVFTSDVGTRTGWHLGALAKADITPYFGVQAEFMYSQKGFGEGNGTVALSVNYIEIPIFLVLQLPGKISPHLLLGAVLGLESGCKVTSDTLDNVPCEEVTVLPLQTKGADSGLMFGLGLDVNAGPGILFGDLMYNYGLTDISEPSLDVDNIKTRTFYVTAGFRFAVGRTSQ